MNQPLPFSSAVLIALFFAICSSQAHAVGMGFSTGIGYENWEDDEGVTYRGDRQVNNVGFVLDTRVRRDRLFGYRFRFLWEKNDGGRMDMQGWSITHDFTFGLVRSETMRFWVGPRLKTTFYNKLTLNTGEQIEADTGWFSDNRLGDVWGFGVGPVMGINIHLPETVTFSFTAALISSTYNGDTDYRTTDGKQYDDLHVDSTGLYLTAGIILRINE
jgi:hypothetical protein